MDQKDWIETARQAASKNMDPIASQILDLPPSCIEFVPLNATEQYFVVGTYNLHKEVEDSQKSQSRDGSLKLFRNQDGDLTLVETQVYPSAILDLHFCPAALEIPVFAVASSTGSISIYEVPFSESCSMRHISTQQILEEDKLTLSLAWYPELEKPDLPLLVVTASNGGVYLIRFTDWTFSACEVLNEKEPIAQHKLMDDPIEAWCCAFSIPPVVEPQVYSGGDDSTLHSTAISSIPLNSNTEENMTVSKQFQISRGHTAGVTGILPLPGTEFIVTGSYDEHIRLFDQYSRREPKLELKIEGGGVWRLKFLDSGHTRDGSLRYTILASCMHAGARIIELRKSDSGENWEFQVLASVTIHKSMCYASDVAPLYTTDSGDGKRIVITTSFYDKLLCVWRYDPAVDVEIL